MASLPTWPTATRPPHLYFSARSQTSSVSRSLGRGAAVEMHVDVDVEFARHLEDAADLGGAVGVVAGRGADDVAPFLRAATISSSVPGLLVRPSCGMTQTRGRSPTVLVDQRLHALEAAQADLGVDLDMGAHARGAVADALLDGRRCALDHVLDREGVLHGRDALHREMRTALGRVLAAAEDARLVEMDVGLDEAEQTSRPPPLHFFLGAAAELRRDGGNAAILHADVGRRLIGLGVASRTSRKTRSKSIGNAAPHDVGTHVAPHCACCTTQTKSRNAADREDVQINSAKRNLYRSMQ